MRPPSRLPKGIGFYYAERQLNDPFVLPEEEDRTDSKTTTFVGPRNRRPSIRWGCLGGGSRLRINSPSSYYRGFGDVLRELTMRRIMDEIFIIAFAVVYYVFCLNINHSERVRAWGWVGCVKRVEDFALCTRLVIIWNFQRYIYINLL